MRPLLLPLLSVLLACPLAAPAMEALSDKALAAVRGRDGVSFDLNGFAMSGDARISYTTPAGSSLYVEKFTAARSDSATPFADPYRLDIVSGGPGLADVVQIAFPQNTNAEQRWQFAYDWGVQADGIVRDGGSVVIQDLVFYGGGLQFSTPRVYDGVAFGAALRFDIGQLAIRPDGRDNSGSQLALTGIRLGGVDADGNWSNRPWVIADVASQPAVINALTDDTGPRLHIGIDWPDASRGSGVAPAGGLQIDNISFVTPGQPTVDLGSSRIGSMQIQYLDIKFRR